MTTYTQFFEKTYKTDIFNNTTHIKLPKNRIWQYKTEAIGKTANKNADKRPILLIGFDTEFQSPEAVTRNQVREGKGKYEVLSYQYHCKVLNPSNEAGLQQWQWEGLCVPEIDEDGKEVRLTVSEFLLLAIGSGFLEHKELVIPSEVYLIGHFTKADLPAFCDFVEKARNELDNIRRTFVDLKGSMKYGFHDGDEKAPFCEIEVFLRDTILIAPTMAKSLADLGEIVGLEKLKLADDVVEEKKLKSNMKLYRDSNWETFKDYAIRDSVVCTKYFERMLNMNFDTTGYYKAPFTLSSIGTELAFQSWEASGLNFLEVLGKEEIETSYYNKKTGKTFKGKKIVSIPKVHFLEDFVTETYHGGRNEQYWFGPGFVDDWYDYDLQSAYTTAMAMIGLPDWQELKVLQYIYELKDLRFDDLAFLLVKFNFPDDTRYPTLAVRALGGNLIFPLEGESYCTIAELRLAEELGVEFKLQFGVSVPTNKDLLIFEDFISDCINKRSEYRKGSFENYFWKEVGNSTYGKTAQGLRLKRVYDVRSDQSQVLPPSKLTNPFFASFITGYVRATLGEIMNKLPQHRHVFNVTTDGFLTNADPDELANACDGENSQKYRHIREQLIGKDEPITEIKHRVKQPLGWRTRGQATIIKGPDGGKGAPNPIVCAKAGLKVEHYFNKEQQNIEVIEKFVNRQPSDKMLIRPFVSIRDQLRYGNDNVEMILEKKLSMEFDWKRHPIAACDHEFCFNGKSYTHLAFNTKPWKSVDEFRSIRDNWDEYIRPTEYRMINLKSVADLQAFVEFSNERQNVAPDNRAYLARNLGTLKRLRRSFVVALFKSHGGFTPKDRARIPSKQNKVVAEWLESCGIPCTAQDVANDKTKEWIYGNVPNTEQALEVLQNLKNDYFPRLDISQFIWQGSGLTLKLDDHCPFIDSMKIEIPLLAAA